MYIYIITFLITILLIWLAEKKKIKKDKKKKEIDLLKYEKELYKQGIKQKSGSRMYEEIAENLEKKEKLASIDEIYKNTGTYRRLYQAVSFYRLPNPYAVTKGVRRDIMAIDRLLDECAYIKKNSLKTMNNIQDRESRLEEMINSLKREKWNKKDASEALDSGQKKQLN